MANVTLLKGSAGFDTSPAPDSLAMVHFENITLDSLSAMSTDSSIQGNFSNVTGKLAKTADCREDEMLWMRYVFNVMICLPIAGVGIVANVVSFVVLQRQKPRMTTTVLLQGLALADTAVLLAMTLLYFLRYISICSDVMHEYLESYAYRNIFRWVYPLVYFFRMTSTWLTVLLTVDRYIAVCHPLRAQNMCTLAVAKRNMGVLLVAAFVCSFPRFFEYHMKSGDFKPTALLANEGYAIGYGIVTFFVLMYLLPMTLLVILNSRLLCALYSASAYRMALPQVNAQTKANNRSITVVVVTIVLMCVISDTTGMVSHILIAVKVCFGISQSAETFRRYLSNVRNVIITISSTGNFFVYCLCSRNFRLALHKTFSCRKIVKSIKKRSSTCARRASFEQDGEKNGHFNIKQVYFP